MKAILLTASLGLLAMSFNAGAVKIDGEAAVAGVGEPRIVPNFRERRPQARIQEQYEMPSYIDEAAVGAMVGLTPNLADKSTDDRRGKFLITFERDDLQSANQDKDNKLRGGLIPY